MGVKLCRLCNSDATHFKLSNKKYTEYFCTACKSVSWFFDESYEYGSDEKYNSLAYDLNYELRWAHRDFFNLAKDKDWSILEIGCHVGGYVKFLSDYTENSIFGLDINFEAIGRGKALSRELENKLFTSITDVPFVDTYILIDVLEHLENPFTFLQNLNVERLYVSSPESNRLFVDKTDWPPHHFLRVNSEGLVEVMKSMGYRCTSCRHEISFVLLVRNILGRFLYGYHKRWYTGSVVYSTGGRFSFILSRIDKLLAVPLRWIGFRYVAFGCLYEKIKVQKHD